MNKRINSNNNSNPFFNKNKSNCNNSEIPNNNSYQTKMKNNQHFNNTKENYINMKDNNNS